MAFYYYKLWKLLNAKGISQNELQRRTGIAPAVFTKMRKNQSISMDTLEKIVTALNCDFGDVVTVKPPKEIENIHSHFSYETAMSVISDALNKYIAFNKITIAEVSRVTGLSVNTIKSCLNGNNISSQSLLKLYKLEGFESHFSIIALQYDKMKKKNTIYCQSCGKRKNACWGFQSVWVPEEKEYENYCAFNFQLSLDENGQYISLNGNCPHPTNYHEFEDALANYEFIQKKEVKYFPAKGESDKNKQAPL